MKVLLGATGLLLLQGCSTPWVKTGEFERGVTLLDVNPPKHLSVTLRDDENGHVYEDIYVSKHCSTYERVPVGSKFRLNFEVYQNKETGEVRVEPDSSELDQIFCY